jgi:hypothetical protein
MDLPVRFFTNEEIALEATSLADFALKFGIISKQSEKEEKIISVLGIEAWKEVNELELNQYRLASKESLKILSALLTRACGAKSDYYINNSLYMESIENLTNEINAKVYIAYENLINRLLKLEVEKEYYLLAIAYDFLASCDKRDRDLATLIIVNNY